MLAAVGRIGAELDLPVILYGELATRPEHAERAWLRQGGWRRLAERIESGEVMPDFGPARAHPTAGVVLAAARPPLVAFNVDLEDADLETAKAIAAEIRESGGGLPGVRAIGLLAGERGRAQVSTNVHDHRVTPLRAIVEAVRRPRGHRGGRAGGPGAVGGLPALPGRRAASAASRPSGTCSRTRYAQSLMAQTKKKRTRKHRGTPGGHDRAAGPHRQRPHRARTPSRSRAIAAPSA